MVKIMETPIKMDDLGVPLFSETSKLEPLGNKFVGQILREYPCINNPNKFSIFLVNKVSFLRDKWWVDNPSTHPKIVAQHWEVHRKSDLQ